MDPPQFGPPRDDPFRHIRQPPGVDGLLRHAQIRAPPDRRIRLIQRGERASAVEHHRDAVRTVGPAAVAQTPPGRHHHRRADRVERDRMCRAQSLKAGDSRHDRHPLHRHQPPGDADRAVVKRGVAPYEQRHPPAAGQMCRDCPSPAFGDRIMPMLDAIEIGPLAAAHRQVELDHPHGCPRQHLRADVAAQVDQFGLVRLARQQDQVGGAHRGLRRTGQVLGIARTDADQVEMDHRSSISGP
ncbi:hypothetical protein SPZE110945_18455 [Sphingomonas zeae]